MLENLRSWAAPRKWAILGGLSPLVGGLIIVALLTDAWWMTFAGLAGLFIGATGVVMFIANPSLWEDPRMRWRALGVWWLVWTSVVLIVVAIVFLVT